jgi:hypothetical protein
VVWQRGGECPGDGGDYGYDYGSRLPLPQYRFRDGTQEPVVWSSRAVSRPFSSKVISSGRRGALAVCLRLQILTFRNFVSLARRVGPGSLYLGERVLTTRPQLPMYSMFKQGLFQSKDGNRRKVRKNKQIGKLCSNIWMEIAGCE